MMGGATELITVFTHRRVDLHAANRIDDHAMRRRILVVTFGSMGLMLGLAHLQILISCDSVRTLLHLDTMSMSIGISDLTYLEPARARIISVSVGPRCAAFADDRGLVMTIARIPVLATSFATCMVVMVAFLACVLLWAVSYHPAMHQLLLRICGLAAPATLVPSLRINIQGGRRPEVAKAVSGLFCPQIRVADTRPVAVTGWLWTRIGRVQLRCS